MKKSKNGEKKIKKNIVSSGLEDIKKIRNRFSPRNEKFIDLKKKMKYQNNFNGPASPIGSSSPIPAWGSEILNNLYKQNEAD